MWYFFFLLIDWRCNKRWPDCHYAAMHLRQTIFSIEWRKICPLFCRFAKRGSSSISKSSDVNKRGPRGQWPPSSWIGPHLFGHGGHRGPHLWSQMASKWCFPANITKISLSPPALVHIIHWNFSRQKLQNSQILLRKSLAPNFWAWPPTFQRATLAPNFSELEATLAPPPAF